MSQLLITAAHKSSGKTTVTLGLCASLSKRGVVIQPFKKGPDYIDPMWLTRASGHACHNLDFYTSTKREILNLFTQLASNADMALIEGNKGLYDGLDVKGSNSNAALAKLLGSPVVLVLDVRGTIRGVAPLLLGYKAFDPKVWIAGVILNQVGNQRHEDKLRAVIEHYTDIPVIGAIRRDSRLELTERHLGLIPSNEHEAADAKIADIAQAVAEQVDLDHILKISNSAKLPRLDLNCTASPPHATDIRLAIARDASFGFYYPGDLQALERAGAQLIPIDMHHDQRLPSIDGLFIGGGFPESHMERLEQNSELRGEIRQLIEAGLPTYAECGGLMYLSRSLSWRGRRSAMVGVIKADTVMHERPQGRGYIRMAETEHCLWPVEDKQNHSAEITGHEFHYSALENLPVNTRYAYRMLRGSGINGKHDGIVYKNTLACYAHLRDTSRYHWTERFIQFVRSCKQRSMPPVSLR
jgi:cobyrinic acid a,c-diamide synthase